MIHKMKKRWQIGLQQNNQKKVPKSTEFVNTDSDDEQGPVVEQLQKVPKTPEYSDDEQEPTAKKHQKPLSTQTMNKGLQ